MNHELFPSYQYPQRWITEITPGGVIRHVQRISPEHIIILPDDLPGIVSDRLLVPDLLADKVFSALTRRAG